MVNVLFTLGVFNLNIIYQSQLEALDTFQTSCTKHKIINHAIRQKYQKQHVNLLGFLIAIVETESSFGDASGFIPNLWHNKGNIYLMTPGH